MKQKGLESKKNITEIFFNDITLNTSIEGKVYPSIFNKIAQKNLNGNGDKI